MALAADRVGGRGGRRVGYADAFGFSAAFKQVHGFSVSECRAKCAAGA